jgi:hypothetical protein
VAAARGHGMRQRRCQTATRRSSWAARAWPPWRGAAAAARGAGSVRHFSFLLFLGASPPVIEPAVMAYTITVDFDPTGIRTGGDAILQPAVMGCVVVKSSPSKLPTRLLVVGTARTRVN